MNYSSIGELLDLLGRLKEKNIHYELGQVREEAIAIFVTVPGERWEIELFSDGTLEIEVFRSDGSIKGTEYLQELFLKWSEKA